MGQHFHDQIQSTLFASIYAGASEKKEKKKYADFIFNFGSPPGNVGTRCLGTSVGFFLTGIFWCLEVFCCFQKVRVILMHRADFLTANTEGQARTSSQHLSRYRTENQ